MMDKEYKVSPAEIQLRVFLATATFRYSIRPGIALAAGTRLGLQFIVAKFFFLTKKTSKSQHMDALHCDFLSLPLCGRIGSFVRLLFIQNQALLPWDQSLPW